MLSFQITKRWGLKPKTHGVALVDERGIRLVFRAAADLAASPREEAESLLIEWDNLVGITAKRGFLADSLQIELHRPPEQSPGQAADRVLHLELQKRNRDALERFERDVEEYRSGRRKNDVDEVLDDVRDFLDRI